MTNSKTVTKIVRESEPVNLEFPFETMDSMITPVESFYVRNHFPEPTIDLQSWRLSIEGLVSKPVKLSYEEIVSMPCKSVTSVLECAGNGRVFLTPKVAGAQWGLGAVGNAEWKGVPLAHVLAHAIVDQSAIDVVFEGGDQGVPEEKPKPRNPIKYARSIPVAKVSDENILLAYEMNGEPLTRSHGFPLRLIVPGWYGMASVKWLERIIVADYSFDGYFQKIDYAFWVEQDGLQIRRAITEMELKSQISQPTPHMVLGQNQNFKVTGAAWSSGGKSGAIDKVEVSVDGGKEWFPAKIERTDNPHAWIQWSYDWKTPAAPTECILMSRAIDRTGKVQPLQRDLNRDTYRISHSIPIPVSIR